MEHYFELPVLYKNEEQVFNGRLATFGYSFKWYIMVEGKELVFEKDDSGEYRVLSDEDLKKDPELLKAIIESLVKLQD